MGVGVLVRVGTGDGDGIGVSVLVRVGTGDGDGVGVGVGVGSLRPRALAAFNLPPVATFPDNEEIISQLFRMLLRIWEFVMEGFLDFMRAATPDT
jgi:hypothetical protein